MASISIKSARDEIHKIDPETGRVLHNIPAPGGGNDSGMAWAEGSVVGRANIASARFARSIRRPARCCATIESNRFVTGVTWVDGELWHGTWENEASELRHIDPQTGDVLDSVEMPAGVFVSGLESDGKDRFLLRRRKEREGQGGAPAHERFCVLATIAV